MKVNPTSKTIERLISSCHNCKNVVISNDDNFFSGINFEFYEFSKSLNLENTVLFHSSNSHRYFHELIESRFPPEQLIDLVDKIIIVISTEITNPVLLKDNLILINPYFSILQILEGFDRTFISLFNRNSINGFKKSIIIDSTLFGRGNQLGKQKTVLFSANKLSLDFLEGQTLLDTEHLFVSEKLMYYQSVSDSFHENMESGIELYFNELCTNCNSKQTVNVAGRKFSEKNTVADKIISFIEADEKLPFFSRAKPEQLLLIQLLFFENESGEIIHYNKFLKKFSLKNQNLEWFIVNSDLFSEKPDPALFVNDLDSFSKILIEVLRGTIMWRKDKFLDFHSVNRLSGSKLKIHDPIHILGEAAYRNKILDWIGELEGKNPENFGFGLKTIFR